MFRPFLVKFFFVLLLDCFILCDLFQAVSGRLLVFSINQTLTITRMSTCMVRIAFISNVDYFKSRIYDFTNILIFW